MFLKNSLFSVLSTIFNFIAPIIVLPVMTRSLSKADLGMVMYQESIAKYISLLLLLGIPLYGVRELSRDTNVSNSSRSGFVWSMMLFQFIVLIVLTIIYLIIYDWDEVNILTLLIGITGGFSFDWVLQGLEKFKTLAVRGMLVKIIYVFLVLYFIRDGNDSIDVLYILLTTNFLLFCWNVHILGEVLLSDKCEVNLKRHIRPLVTVFGSLIVITFYTMLDSIILGELSSLSEVAIYNIGLRLPRALTVGMSSVLLVFIPLLNKLHSISDGDFKFGLRLSLDFILLVTIPMFLLLFVNADTVVNLLTSSQNYGDSADVLRLLAALPLLIGISNFLGVQLLTTCGFDRGLLFASIFGALASLLINVSFIPVLGAYGASIANLSAELVVVIVLLFYAKRNNLLSFFDLKKISHSRGSFFLYLLAFFTMIVFPETSLKVTVALNLVIILGIIANSDKYVCLLKDVSKLN